MLVPVMLVLSSAKEMFKFVQRFVAQTFKLGSTPLGANVSPLLQPGRKRYAILWWNSRMRKVARYIVWRSSSDRLILMNGEEQIKKRKMWMKTEKQKYKSNYALVYSRLHMSPFALTIPIALSSILEYPKCSFVGDYCSQGSITLQQAARRQGIARQPTEKPQRRYLRYLLKPT